jgi:hypothetical protein
MIDFPASPTIGQTFIDPTTNLEWMWDGTKWVASGIAGGPFVPQAGFVPAMNDNRIINGDMRIDQRNNGAGGTAAGAYTVDRWLYAASQVVGIWARNNAGNGTAGPASFPYCLGFAPTSAHVSAAADYFQFVQNIEADMVSDFAWGTPQAQPVTLSFWAYCTLTGVFSGALGNAAGTRSYPFTYTIPTANVWTKVVVTIPGDTGGTWVMSGNTAGVGLHFDLGSGANYRGPAGVWANASYAGATGAVSVVATNGSFFAFTGVKLEVGSVATPFNRQSLAKSFADCQRYYQTGQFAGWSYGSASAGVYQSQTAFVTMRAQPTMAITANNCSNFTGLSWIAISSQIFTLAGTVGTTGGYLVNINFTASAEL